jgi:hypothetical protein
MILTRFFILIELLCISFVYSSAQTQFVDWSAWDFEKIFDFNIDEPSEANMLLDVLNLDSIVSISSEGKYLGLNDAWRLPDEDTIHVNIYNIIVVNFTRDFPNPPNRLLEIKGSDDSVLKVQLNFSSRDKPTKKQSLIVIPPPFIRLPQNSTETNHAKNRYLIIDANSDINYKYNTSLKKRIKGKGTSLEKASSMPVRGSLTVLIKNYRFGDIERVTVEINGVDYVYKQDVSNLLDAATSKDDSGKAKDISGGISSAKPGVSESVDKKTERLLAYLTSVYKLFSRYTSLNINDLYTVKKYQQELFEFFTANTNDILITPEMAELLGKCVGWQPQSLSLTPISLVVPSADEVTIILKIKHKNQADPTEVKVGTYKTSGGIGIGVGSQIYITGLANNTVYTDSIGSGSGKELRAFIEHDKHYSVGIGFNSEVYFRTGSIVKPTLNLGFFIPFEEEITPFIALGPGIAIADDNVKFSLSGGLAIGKINAISERYRDKDLSSFPTLTNESISTKIWDAGLYFAVGVSYNLAGGSPNQ